MFFLQYISIMKVEPVYKVEGECVFWFNSNDDYKHLKLNGSTIVDPKGYKSVFVIENGCIRDLNEKKEEMVDFVESESEHEHDQEQEERQQKIDSLDTMGMFFKNLIDVTQDAIKRCKD